MRSGLLGLPRTFAIFCFIRLDLQRFLAKNGQREKITKNENFQNRPNMTFYGLK
jgi:hypothetical protein